VEAWQYPVVFVAGLAAGAVNALAGGGSVISFPTLLYAGIGPIVANATNTVALWPGLAAAAYGYRGEIEGPSRRFLWLIAPSVAGGILGALLLLHTPPEAFEVAAPYLVLFATLLLALRDVLGKLRRRDQPIASSRTWWAAASATQLVIAVYGGYFGAGIGILMLASLGLLGFTDIHRMNGLKSIFALSINGAALVYFIIGGIVLWPAVAAMAVGAVMRGFIASRGAYRIGRATVRKAVISIGFAMTLALLARLYL
jgi:uncharacterized membrane protein YfcA